MPPVVIRGMWGLGDNIYQRPFIRAAAARRGVYLETPWPELYADLPVRFVRGERRLRTQMRNVDRQPAARWSEPPKGAAEIRLGYGSADFARGSIIAALERQLPLAGAPLVFDLPPFGRSPVRPRRPIAVVRPVTVRSEWRNEARNPRPEYVAELAAALARTHHVVAVADCESGSEWLLPPAPPAQRSFLAGELPVGALLALLATADVVVGGVGWIVPAAIALGVKAFIVLGGHGGHNAPAKVTDPRLDLTRIGFAMPQRYCLCSQMLHVCDKTIADLPLQFASWARYVGLECSTHSRRVA